MTIPPETYKKEGDRYEPDQGDITIFPCRLGEIKRIKQPGFCYYHCYIDRFDVVYGRLTGKGTLDDILLFFKTAQEDSHRGPETRVLCDVRNANVDVSFPDMFQFVKKLDLYAGEHGHQTELLIILTGKPASYGKGRMFESLNSTSYKEVLVIMDINIAAKKLGVEPDIFDYLVSKTDMLEAEKC